MWLGIMEILFSSEPKVSFLFWGKECNFINAQKYYDKVVPLLPAETLSVSGLPLLRNRATTIFHVGQEKSQVIIMNPE